jgi:hypothetical protein
MSYAKGKYAFGFCDKTGFRYPLKDLVPEYRNGVKTGFLVGRDVVDPDQPQNFLGRFKIHDPQALRNPRPDTGLIASRTIGSTYTVRGVSASGGVGVVNVVVPSEPVDVNIAGVSSTGGVGPVAVATTSSTSVIVAASGVSSIGSVGAVSVVTTSGSTADTFDSTSVTLDSSSQTFDEG